MLDEQQIEVLGRPIHRSRVAKRSQGGKQLSYLEAWDVKAHLIRLFGYGNFDAELLDYGHITTREYQSNDGKDMVEVIYYARVRLTVRDHGGKRVCRYTEGACGTTSGPASMLGEHHDNALKTAESDALKRAAVYLGNQFGLSLYDNGSTLDVVKQVVGSIIEPAPTTEQQAQINHTLGAGPDYAVPIGEQEQPDERGSESNDTPVPATT